MPEKAMEMNEYGNESARPYLLIFGLGLLFTSSREI